MPIILGIDPGSRKTGYGVVASAGPRLAYVASGIIRIDPALTLPERLDLIYRSVREICQRHVPQECAIENVFMAKSAGSALKLGQARGAAIVAAGAESLEVFEYEARKVKQAVVGTGAADKLQVQHMVKHMLALPAVPKEDAADALAVAICHANTQTHLIKTAAATKFRRGRMV